MRPSLPERQVAPQHRESVLRKRFAHRDQQRRLAVRARPVRQHQPAARIALRSMQEPSNSFLNNCLHRTILSANFQPPEKFTMGEIHSNFTFTAAPIRFQESFRVGGYDQTPLTPDDF